MYVKKYHQEKIKTIFYTKDQIIKEYWFNIASTIKEIFNYVPSGYSDGFIKVDYEIKTQKMYSPTKEEYIDVDLYTCKFYLVPKKEYVYVEDNIYHELQTVIIPGDWVDYVCNLVDELKEEEQNKDMQRKRIFDK